MLWIFGLFAGLPKVLAATSLYYSTIVYYHKTQQHIDSTPDRLWPDYLRSRKRQLVHLYSLAKWLEIWDKPHYRSVTVRHDMQANLRNVAIPGTGIPLSFFCRARWLAVLFIFVINPISCLIAAIYSAAKIPSLSVDEYYRELLLQPGHWLATWRLNSLLAAYHARVTSCKSYALEDKGTFLVEGERLGLPVSPFIKAPKVYVKHRSIEGGMGIHTFKNFADGGEWILQRGLRNSEFFSRLLPADAPLSTLRVVTASISWLQRQKAVEEEQEELEEQQYVGREDVMRAWEGFLGVDDGLGSADEDAAGAEEGGAFAGPVSPELPLSSGVMNTLDPRTEQQGSAAALGRGGDDKEQQQDQQEEEAQPWRPRPPREQQQKWWLAVEPVQEEPTPQEEVQQVEEEEEEVAAEALQGDQEEEEEDEEEDEAGPTVEAVAAVWRAGLSGADTDHKSICFTVDTDTGELGEGTSSEHWYQVGWKGLFRVAPSAFQTWTYHPDSEVTVAGEVIPDFANILRQVESAHRLLVPDVPLVGWDVALTPAGPYLLEMNLSCNFFNAAFDMDGYAEMLFEFFLQLEQLERTAPLRVIRGQKRRERAREGAGVIRQPAQREARSGRKQQQSSRSAPSQQEVAVLATAAGGAAGRRGSGQKLTPATPLSRSGSGSGSGGSGGSSSADAVVQLALSNSGAAAVPGLSPLRAGFKGAAREGSLPSTASVPSTPCVGKPMRPAPSSSVSSNSVSVLPSGKAPSKASSGSSHLKPLVLPTLNCSDRKSYRHSSVSSTPTAVVAVPGGHLTISPSGTPRKASDGFLTPSGTPKKTSSSSNAGRDFLGPSITPKKGSSSSSIVGRDFFGPTGTPKKASSCSSVGRDSFDPSGTPKKGSTSYFVLDADASGTPKKAASISASSMKWEAAAAVPPRHIGSSSTTSKAHKSTISKAAK